LGKAPRSPPRGCITNGQIALTLCIMPIRY
jgi:hypothetical protein